MLQTLLISPVIAIVRRTSAGTSAHWSTQELSATNMYNSSQSQLTFKDDDLDDLLISQPNEFSQMNFNDFTLPSQTQASQSDHFGSQVRKGHVDFTIEFPRTSDDARVALKLSFFSYQSRIIPANRLNSLF